MSNLTSENCSEFIRQASKIVPEWNGHLEISSCPQTIGNICFSRYFTENTCWVPLTFVCTTAIVWQDENLNIV